MSAKSSHKQLVLDFPEPTNLYALAKARSCEPPAVFELPEAEEQEKQRTTERWEVKAGLMG